MTESRAAEPGIVILDRDGTIVEDRGYLSDPDGLVFKPAAAEGLRLLTARGWRLIVMTNQSGVGRGLFPLEQVYAMNVRLLNMVAEAGARLDAIYFCPHAPEAGCPCRKPALGMMRQAVGEFGFDPHRAVVVGDKSSDIEFGHAAGSATILISTDVSASPAVVPDLVAPNLEVAALAIVKGLRRGHS